MMQHICVNTTNNNETIDFVISKWNGDAMGSMIEMIDDWVQAYL